MDDEYDDTTCLDGDGDPWPEHDFNHGGECTRCGAEEER